MPDGSPRPCIGYIRMGVATRMDADDIRAYVERGGYAPVRELEVYALCIRDGLSVARCATALGIYFETARVYLRRLRARVRQPHVTRMRRARAPRFDRAAA